MVIKMSKSVYFMVHHLWHVYNTWFVLHYPNLTWHNTHAICQNISALLIYISTTKPWKLYNFLGNSFGHLWRMIFWKRLAWCKILNLSGFGNLNSFQHDIRPIHKPTLLSSFNNWKRYRRLQIASCSHFRQKVQVKIISTWRNACVSYVREIKKCICLYL